MQTEEPGAGVVGPGGGPTGAVPRASEPVATAEATVIAVETEESTPPRVESRSAIESPVVETPPVFTPPIAVTSPGIQTQPAAAAPAEETSPVAATPPASSAFGGGVLPRRPVTAPPAEVPETVDPTIRTDALAALAAGLRTQVEAATAAAPPTPVAPVTTPAAAPAASAPAAAAAAAAQAPAGPAPALVASPPAGPTLPAATAVASAAPTVPIATPAPATAASAAPSAPTSPAPTPPASAPPAPAAPLPSRTRPTLPPLDMNAEAPPNYVGRHGRREEAAAAARSAAPERPLPTAPAVPAPRVFTAPPPFAPGSSAPPAPTTVPGPAWTAPVSGPAARPASAPPYPQISAPPAARPRRSRALTTVITILVVLVVAQAAGLGVLGWDYLHVRKQQQAANVSANAKINDLETRTAALEAAANAAMDPGAVAKDALPSVFQVDAGDVIGTSWAIAHPTTGGTYLVTNFHVVSDVYTTGGRQVTVERKQQRYTAKIQNVDQRTDLALLYVPDQVFPVLAISKTSVVGEPIVALGEPFGLEDTVTAGVISDVQRQVQGAPSGISYLQFDAAINPGNSGGPLVNAARQVIGIVTLKYQDAEGLALALPVSAVCDSFGIC